MSARYSPQQRYGAQKFVAGTVGVSCTSAHAAKELAEAVRVVYSLVRADGLKTWTPKA